MEINRDADPDLKKYYLTIWTDGMPPYSHLRGVDKWKLAISTEYLYWRMGRFKEEDISKFYVK